MKAYWKNIPVCSTIFIKFIIIIGPCYVSRLIFLVIDDPRVLEQQILLLQSSFLFELLQHEPKQT